MNWDSIGKSVATFAPAIGSAIGGPVGAVAGWGIKTLCGFFGIEADAPDAEDQIETALNSMTPEQAIALKKQDQDFQLEMKKLGVNVFKLEVQDKKSARNMYIQGGKLPQLIIAALVLIGAGAAFYCVLADKIPEGASRDLVVMVLTLLISEFKNITAFFFGSSMGSKAKTDILASKGQEA